MSLIVPVADSKSSVHSEVGATQRSNTILQSPHVIRMASPGFIAASVLQEVRGSDQKVDAITSRQGWPGKSSGNSLGHAVASNGPGIPTCARCRNVWPVHPRCFPKGLETTVPTL